MALTKEQRDALPESDFAVPSKRALPMHDEKHVRMAWDMVTRTKDLTDEERSAARHRILEKAKSLGVDTTDWATIKAMAFEAMSLAMPEVTDHPNRMPFEGILTRIDEPSDAPPGGAGGRRVLLPKIVAERVLATLLGMAVDYTENFDKHDAQKKIGIITEAWIDGSAIKVKGFVYAADFPDTAARIRADKDVLGFSFEMKSVRVADPGADPLVIEDCVFTGAAILRKDKAAYQTTSLAASKDTATGDIDMTKEEIAAAMASAMAEALKPVTDKLAAIEASQAKVETDLKAGKETHAKIKPHADSLRACSAAMEAAGVGGHATKGPAAHLNRMADRFEADAMVGKLPHIYRDHDFFVDASTEGKDAVDPNGEAVKSIIAAATKPLLDQVAALGTKVEDLKTKAFNAASEPERKTLSADVRLLLEKNGFDLAANGDKKVSVADFDAFLDKAGKHGTEAITLKLQARASGLLAA